MKEQAGYLLSQDTVGSGRKNEIMTEKLGFETRGN